MPNVWHNVSNVLKVNQKNRSICEIHSVKKKKSRKKCEICSQTRIRLQKQYLEIVQNQQ